MKNKNQTVWAIYNKKGNLVVLSKSRREAQEQALKSSKYRWTFQTFKKDWGYLVEDGYKLAKSEVVAI